MKNKENKLNKKNLITIMILIILTLGIGTGIFFITKPKSSPNIQFTLVKESGVVSYRNNESDQYKTLDSDQIVLQNNAFVKTTDSYAHVIFVDNSLMSIDVNSEVQITVKDFGTTIDQILGNTWHRVEKLAHGKEYTVTTPTSLAAVRGTKFGIDAGKTGSSTFVIEGAVDVGQIEIVNGQKEWKNRQSVIAGKSANIPDFKRIQKIDVANISPEQSTSNWYIRNKQLDKDYDNKGDLKNAIKKIRDNKNFNTKQHKQLSNLISHSDGDNYADPKICENYTSTSYQEYMLSIDQIAASGNDAAIVQKNRDYINAIFDACKDGILTIEEIQTINSILSE